MSAEEVIAIGDTGREIALTDSDVVFGTNRSITEYSTYGDNDTLAPIETHHGGVGALWKNLAAQDHSFGRPEKFCENVPEANWTISATVTLLDDKIAPYIENLTGRDPHSGVIVPGGPCTFRYSNWLYSYTMSRQPHFKVQDPQAETGRLAVRSVVGQARQLR